MRTLGGSSSHAAREKAAVELQFLESGVNQAASSDSGKVGVCAAFYPLVADAGEKKAPPWPLCMSRRDGREEAALMKTLLNFWSLALVALAFWRNASEVVAWHDQAHMLVAAVAREYLKPDTVEKIEAILAEWTAEYPTTSTLETAAVWLDHVACSMPGRYCRGFLRQDDIRIFKPWHYTSHVYNPQGLTLDPRDAVQPYPQTGSAWILIKAYESLRNCRSEESSPKASAVRAPREAEATNGGGPPEPPQEEQAREEEVARGADMPVAFLHSSLSSSSFFPLLQAFSEKLAALLSWSSSTSAPEFAGTSGRSVADYFVPPALVFSRPAEDAQGPRRNAGGAKSEKAAAAESAPAAVCSKLSLNLHLRVLLHVYGDAHQPLHSTETFSTAFPKGDDGGNNITVILPGSVAGAASGSGTENPLSAGEPDGTETAPRGPPGSAPGDEAWTESPRGEKRSRSSHTLHSEWDAAFGQYDTLFYDVDMTELKKEAQRLVKLHPLDAHARKTFLDFAGIVRESHQLAREHVFSEFDWATFSSASLPYGPSREYVEKSQAICEKQIALGGARLALVLESLSASLPAPPSTGGSALASSSQASALESAAGSVVGEEGAAALRPSCAASEDSVCVSRKRGGNGPVLLFSEPSASLESAAVALQYSRPLSALLLALFTMLLCLLLALVWTCRQLKFYKHAISLTTGRDRLRRATDEDSAGALAAAASSLECAGLFSAPSAVVAPQRRVLNAATPMATRLLASAAE
ncbi:hypothetical protein BESB_068460 [Besnoitia besnoiti]|uniref:S1/P1 nuclease n=1 Tax=Besnoitia besnoiti TaxID=94643 RepID=A0A2A9MGM6_BESBE|nr:hypothetical protein BESB_068460 [Besnoitia besnoiti]PFH34813.1 hypothetical protein BESB_068460 [Besnoitia besnoiti]